MPQTIEAIFPFPSVDSVTTVEGLRDYVKDILILFLAQCTSSVLHPLVRFFVPSVDSATPVEGLRAFAKEISFLRFVPSVDSVTTVEGLRGLFKENLFPNLFY